MTVFIWIYTNTYERYGTSSDDVNFGKWVKHVEESMNIHVEHLHSQEIVWCGPGGKNEQNKFGGCTTEKLRVKLNISNDAKEGK